jgi:transketolase
MASTVRRSDLAMINRAKLGHIGGDFSVTDILVTLYGAVLNVDPTNPTDPERDRFVLSKGHCAGALYSTLAECGFFDVAELRTFAQPLSPLNGHPNRNKVPGWRRTPARSGMGSRSRSGTRSPRSCRARRAGRSSSWVTAKCRRAAIGRPP